MSERHFFFFFGIIDGYDRWVIMRVMERMAIGLVCVSVCDREIMSRRFRQKTSM